MYATAKNSNGILAWADSVNVIREEFLEAHRAAVIAQASAQLGGLDWEYVSLTDDQYKVTENAMPARSKLVNGVLTSATPPTATLSTGTVDADGLATITLTANVHDSNYNGVIRVSVIAPDNSLTTEDLTAVAGVASEVISTALVGEHQVTIETVLHGLAIITFEGV